MNELKAFVGHSFTKDDEAVVRAFLKFFDQVKNMNIGFSWEHAEAAEPKELADKVLRLNADKNLFIGICTNKEATIQIDKLKQSILSKNTLKAEKADFGLKTSDWIIQEIGLAVGLRMDLILLLEKDLRLPGGLQGNLEYIVFERQSPEKSFGKVLEMIQALLPRAKAPTSEPVEARSVPKDVPKLEEEASALEPKDDWDRRKYEFALFHMVAADDKEGEKSIGTAYLASKDGSIRGNRESWEAFHEYVRLLFGKDGKLTRLEEIARNCSENPEVLSLLAKAYQLYEDHEKAAKYFKMAAAKVDGPSKQQLSKYTDALLALTKAGKKEEANEIVSTMEALAPNIEDGDQLILSAFRQVAHHEGDRDRLFGLTERLLQLKPADIETRFNLAYDYSQAQQDDASLFHYLKIPYAERGNGAWNNLGVEFDHFELNSKAVEAYRKAEDLGNTLAMANHAYKLMKAGFLHEAEELCNKAMTIKEYHKNVSHAIAEIKDIPDKEEKKEKEIVDKALPVTKFYRDYGTALLQGDQPDHTGRWQGPDCELNIIIKDNRFRAEGSYEQESSGIGLLGFAFGPAATGVVPKKEQYRITYEGFVDGLTVKCTMKREKVGGSPSRNSLLGLALTGVDVLMILSDPLREIKCYEKGKERKFYTISRME
jgi:hypothetical protein